MSSRAWDISSRCFFRVKLRSVALRSSTLPLSAKEFSRLTEGDFLGTRGTPLVVPILILSNKPAYSISAPKTNRTQTMTQASIAGKESRSNLWLLRTYSSRGLLSSFFDYWPHMTTSGGSYDGVVMTHNWDKWGRVIIFVERPQQSVWTAPSAPFPDPPADLNFARKIWYVYMTTSECFSKHSKKWNFGHFGAKIQKFQNRWKYYFILLASKFKLDLECMRTNKQTQK